MLGEKIAPKESQGLSVPFERLWATIMTFLILQIVLNRLRERPVGGGGMG